MTRIRTRVMVVLAVVFALPAGSAILEEIVATVNGEVITMTQLEDQEREIRAMIQASMSGADLERALDEYQDTLLVDMINQLLLYQRGERMGLDLNQVYRSYLDNFKKQNNIKDNDELMSLLEQEGMTLEDFRTFLLRRFVPEIMINIEVREKIAITDAEAEAHYLKNRGDYANPASYTFREIALLLRSHGEDEAMDLARKIREELDAGADFASLVENYSEAPSKDQEGLVKDVPGPEMAAVIRKALSDLEVGQVSEPVTTSLAVMVLKLESRSEASIETLEQVRPKVEAELRRAKYDEALDEYVRKLWSESQICVMQKYRTRYPTDHYRAEGDSEEAGCSWG